MDPDSIPVLVTHDDPWTEDFELLDDEAQEALALLQSLGEPPFAALIAGPIHVRVGAYGVVTSTITRSAGELYLHVGDGWSRVLWRRHAGTACEWTWQTATTPALVQALLQDRAQERRLMLGRRVLASEYVYRDASGEERRTQTPHAPDLDGPDPSMDLRCHLDVRWRSIFSAVRR